MKKIKGIKNAVLPYHERLKNYERDKQALLGSMRDKPASEFAEALRKLQEKWGI